MRPDARLRRRPGRSALPGAAAGLLALLLSFSGLAPATSLAADLTPQQQVESQLMCYCGCTDLTVRVCTCGTADSIRGEIAERLAQGESPARVVAAFVARHGETMRSAPTKEGFNLLAWIAPFAALLIAGGAIVAVVRRWESRGASAVAAPPATLPLTAEERESMKRVEREIREGF